MKPVWLGLSRFLVHRRSPGNDGPGRRESASIRIGWLGRWIPGRRNLACRGGITSSRAKIREQIIDLLQQGSLTAEAINNELRATDPKQKQKIANVLSLMKQEGAITQEQRRGPYTLAKGSSDAHPQSGV